MGAILEDSKGNFWIGTAGDGLQMPGSFVFHRGEIIAASRARSASDLPDLPGLFQTADRFLAAGDQTRPTTP